MPNLAPVALFCYNRPDHTARTLEALALNHEARSTRVVVYADGPKKPEHEDAVAATRKVVRMFVNRFESFDIVERSTNMGLAASIIGGVTELTDLHGRAIILEDDLETAPHFLSFMNKALHVYRDCEQVMHISGYTYPIETKNIPGETFLLRIPMCWGWGTWKRSWQYFTKDKTPANKLSRDSISYLNFGDSHDYHQQHILNQQGKIDTWFIYWYMALEKHRGLSLFPRDSAVQNIGTDATGTHKVNSDQYRVTLGKYNPRIDYDPALLVTECKEATEAHIKFFHHLEATQRRGRLKRLLGRLRSSFNGA